MINKNTDSQPKRGLESNELKKNNKIINYLRAEKVLRKQPTGDEFVTSNNGHHKVSVIFC